MHANIIMFRLFDQTRLNNLKQQSLNLSVSKEMNIYYKIMVPLF